MTSRVITVVRFAGRPMIADVTVQQQTDTDG